MVCLSSFATPGRLTLLDFISLFLIASIAADDILLLYNTYQLAPALHRKEMKPAEKMRWAYREASAAMLVTSATTCGSFYANLLSIVTVVRAFGFFMGTLVVWNFLNVLTIFPSALLVNDMYLIPCLRYLCCCCCRGTGNGQFATTTQQQSAMGFELGLFESEILLNCTGDRLPSDPEGLHGSKFLACVTRVEGKPALCV